MTERQAGQGRAKLGLIAFIFIAPLVVAAWMYYGNQGWQPVGRTNHGVLLEPIVNLNEAPRPDSLWQLTDTEGRWVMILREGGACQEACRDALYRMRQSRLMLGNDMTRVARIFLHGDIGPDTVWLDGEHPGLITINNEGLSGMLNRKKPQGSGSGGLYLVDPLGNLVMYFAPDLAPEDMVSDIEHLLELSRIG